jgi:hypothetical protein
LNPITGNNNNQAITVSAGQTVYISAYTGGININGGTLVICGTGTSPSYVNINGNATASIVVNGSVTFNNININNSNLSFYNYGSCTFGNVTSNGPVENDGTMTFSYDYENKLQFLNTGTVIALSSFYNTGTITNRGIINVSGTLHNNGPATLKNSCTITANQFINDNSTYNTGTIGVTTSTMFNGNSTYNAGAGSMLQTATFGNDGAIKGDAANCATIKITQSANVNSSNVSGIIDICGITTTSNSSFNAKVVFACGCSAGSFGIQYAWTPASGLNDATSATPTVTNPTATTTYTVKVTDANGSTGSDDVTVTVIPCSHVTISPNPYTQYINIMATTTVTGNATIYVRNSQGQLITQQGIQTNSTQTVWLNWLTSGSYTVQVVTSEYTESKIIIKN